MNTYGPSAQATIEKTMQAYSQGKLHSGKSGKRVTSRKQAVAIGISKARQKLQKTPKQGAK